MHAWTANREQESGRNAVVKDAPSVLKFLRKKIANSPDRPLRDDAAGIP